VGLSFIPSPSVSGFHLGLVEIHFYALMYLVGIALAIYITRRRWRAQDGDPDLVTDVAIWSVPAGIVGGRIYFDITTPQYIPHHWYGVFAVWTGGLGIWGGVAMAAVVGAWRVRKRGADVALFMDSVAPALLVAQAIGGSGTTSTRSCTVARPACRGRCRSRRTTGTRASPGLARSSRHSCTR
jgi:prolipoprotein diacylglyceryltransferase